jgi:hypothetical protein
LLLAALMIVAIVLVRHADGCRHQQSMDKRFMEGTTEQLRLMGKDWNAVWLRQEELTVVNQLQSEQLRQ